MRATASSASSWTLRQTAKELCNAQDLAVVKWMVGFVPKVRGKHSLVFDSFVPWAVRRASAQLRSVVDAEMHPGMLRPFAAEGGGGGSSKRVRADVPPRGDTAVST